MSDSKNRAGSSKRRHARVIKVAPVTRAIRSVLAISATTLALSASGGVFAGTLAAPAATAIHHDIARRDAFQPVIDLTVVHDAWAPSSVNASASDAWSVAATNGIAQQDADALSIAPSLGDVADLTTVRAATSGPGGVSGSDDNIGYSVDDPAIHGFSYAVHGPISANSTYGIADGVFAGVGSVAHLVNYDTITATGSTWAAGFEVEATDYAHDVRNNSGATITASTNGANGQAWGIYAVSGDGTDVYNDGSIAVSSSGKYSTATAVYAVATGGDAYVGNSGSITANSKYGSSNGIEAFAYGDATLVNSGDITAIAGIGGNGTGMLAYSVAGDADITSTSDITAGALIGSAIGMYAYSVAGNVGVHNSAGITAFSKYGSAYAIYAASGGGDVTVDNGGSIEVTVGNPGSSPSLATRAAGNTAFGVFANASGGDGDARVTNTADISVASIDNAYGVVGVSATGDVDINNSTGSITVYGEYGVAIGMSGYADSGTSKVSNGGDLSVYSYTGPAIGLSSVTTSGDAVVDNGGSIYAGSYLGPAIGVAGYSQTGNVSLTSSGSIETYSYASASIGMYGYASAGDVNVDVAGSISAYSYYGLADGVFASGATVEVSNAATIYANGYGWAAGIEAQGADAVNVTNAGDISVVSFFGGHGYGVYATGGAGGATVNNGGTIALVGSYVTGVYARADGDVTVDNSGSINAGSADTIQYTYLATGIRALTNYDDSNIVVTSSGDIAAYGYYGARGIDADAAGTGSSASVNSSGNIHAQQSAMYGYGAIGIIASGDLDASVVNSGTITTASGGISYGAEALAFGGNASVTNSGDIIASTTASGYYSAIGALSSSANGTASAANSGSITATALYYIGTGMKVEGNVGAIATNSGSISTDALVAYGIHATSGQGDVTVDNQLGGSIQANSDYAFALGVYGSSSAGDVLIGNEGNIEAIGYRAAYGIFATADAGDVSIDSSGTILGYSVGMANGIYAVAAAGDATVVNEGGIQAISLADNAYGVMAVANAGDVAVGNVGSIYASSQAAAAIGVWASARQGNALVTNGGAIDVGTAYAGGTAFGVLAQGYAGVQVVNGGQISAVSVPGASAIGVVAQGYGNVLVNNSGEVSATDSDYAVAIQADSVNGVATVVNSGTLRTFSTREGQVAVSGGDGVQEIANYGDIYGAIITAGGDDVMLNGDAGVWHVTNHSTDFGAGDDAITNAGAGTIVLANGAIHMGASGSAGNAFTNDGRVWVRGNGLIDMGSAATLAAGANALPMTNNGVLDMVDGVTDDALTIAGDLAGSGSVDVDIAPKTNHADQLYVNGSVAGSQSVDVNLVGVPLSGHIDPVAFAHVTGDSSADSFIGGHVVGYDDTNFLDIRVNVISQIDTSNAAADVFSVGLDVLGLNDAGSLGATVATVAQGVMTSQIGTWRQRMGVIAPKRDDQVGLSPWIRVFGDSGSVKLAHQENNFGSSGAFGFDQSNNGREFGLNVNIRSDLNIGLLAAKATGTQHLTGTGVGSDHLDSTAFGMYATWIAPQFYLDASYRWLDFDAHFRSAGGLQGTRGNGGAFNVEAGYTAWTFAGIGVTPQLQYTRSHVGDFSTIHGNALDFVPNGGASTRGRLGVEFSKTMEGAGWVWTPYGSVNAIREFDGETNYSVGNNFTGFTSTKGTSGMVELGVGAQKDGVSITGGANWTDGGAYQGVLGGQVVVRYSW
jgi:outer membrane autotransporter protein